MAMNLAFPAPATAESATVEITMPVVSGPAAGGLAESPVAIVAVLAAWVSSGLIVAYVMHRRGHEFRTMAVFGAAFGPLFIGLASTITRDDEEVDPIVLRTGRPGDGSIDVLVAFDDADAQDDSGVASVLALLEPAVRRVALARTIDFQSARDEKWADAKAQAAADLVGRAEGLGSYDPSTVLVPGPAAKALVRHAVREGYDVLVVGGSRRSALLRFRWIPGEADSVTVVIPPARPPVGPGRRAGISSPRLAHSRRADR